MKERRVGTLTLGCGLIVYGILFLLHQFIGVIRYQYIFKAWPVVFLLLGGEILYYAIRYKEEKFRYDFGAVLLIGALLLFAMCMAGADWFYMHSQLYNIHF